MVPFARVALASSIQQSELAFIEIEDVATQCPGVREAAAIGVPDARSGQTVKLFVIRSDPNLDKAALTKFMHERLAGYKVPTIIEFVETLPKSNIGKILRKDLR